MWPTALWSGTPDGLRIVLGGRLGPVRPHRRRRSRQCGLSTASDSSRLTCTPRTSRPSISVSPCVHAIPALSRSAPWAQPRGLVRRVRSARAGKDRVHEPIVGPHVRGSGWRRRTKGVHQLHQPPLNAVAVRLRVLVARPHTTCIAPDAPSFLARPRVSAAEPRGQGRIGVGPLRGGQQPIEVRRWGRRAVCSSRRR